MAAAECRIRRRKNSMKRLITLATVLLVGLASVQAAQTDDQQKKKKKKAQTTQAATAQASSGGQTSNQRVSSQINKRHVSSQTSSNQQVTNRYYKKGHSNAEAAASYNQHQNIQLINKSKQRNIVTNNNVQVNKMAWRHFRRTGNELSFSAA